MSNLPHPIFLDVYFLAEQDCIRLFYLFLHNQKQMEYYVFWHLQIAKLSAPLFATAIRDTIFSCCEC